MRQKLFTALTLALTIALATTSFTACGDDDDSNGSASAGQANLDGAVEGADGSTEAGSLTDAQEQDVCQALNAYIASAITEDEVLQFSCTFAGAIAASFAGAEGDAAVMACEEARTQCVSEGFDESGDGLGEDCSNFSLSESCTATLDEMEACISAQASAIKELANTLTCSTAVNDQSALAGFGENAACTTVEMKCPEFFEDSSSGGSSGSGGDCSTNPGPDCCVFANDGECDEPSGFCDAGTDTTDCSG